jgi:DNA-binding response OmpR family regulator
LYIHAVRLVPSYVIYRKIVLHRAKILIVEDEAVIALHLAMVIEDQDGQVVGPAASVAEATEMIAAGVIIEGAVLDEIWGMAILHRLRCSSSQTVYLL